MLGCLLGLGVLAKTLPFHAQLQPEALATSRGASGAKPVHVSEMFEDVCDLGTDWRPLSEMGLKPKAAGISETGVQEDAMYNAEPVCGLTEEGGSPGEYCKFGIRDFCGTAIDTVPVVRRGGLGPAWVPQAHARCKRPREMRVRTETKWDHL